MLQARLGAGALDLVEQVIGGQVFSRHHAAGVGHNCRVQPQALGDGQRVGAAWQAHDQAVGGLQGLEVEFDAGVAHAGRLHPVDFELGVMGGDQRGDATILEIVEQGARQGRALGRVGAGADFVENHQRAAVGLRQDVDDIGHVRRKGGERLLDTLFVADISENALKNGKLGCLSRDMQSALRHQREQADGL